MRGIDLFDADTFLLRHESQPSDDAGEQTSNVDALPVERQRAGLDPGMVQQRLDQPMHRLGRAVDDVEQGDEPGRWGLLLLSPEKARCHENGGQRVAQIVRNRLDGVLPGGRQLAFA